MSFVAESSCPWNSRCKVLFDSDRLIYCDICPFSYSFSKKLKARWSIEQAQDLKALYGLSSTPAHNK